MLYLIYFIIFYIGSCIGSFLNATALRIKDKFKELVEKEELNFFRSLIEEIKLLKLTYKPLRSFCPICRNTLKWYHNIPLFSFIFLKGKCAFCKTKIDYIYFLSELIIGIITFLIFQKYYLTLHYSLIPVISLLIGLYILYIGVLLDVKLRLIPDFTIIFSIPFFIIFSYYYNQFNLILVAKNILLGIIFYITTFYIIYFIYERFNKLIFGIADLKIIALFILILGFNSNILIVFFMANYLALPFIIYQYLKKKENKIYFGPFLYISFIIYLLYSQEIHSFFFNRLL